MSKAMILGIGIAVAVVAYLVLQKRQKTGVSGAAPSGVAAGGREDLQSAALRGLFGIANTQLGNVFGQGGKEGASPAGSENSSVDQMIGNEIGGWIGN